MTSEQIVANLRSQRDLIDSQIFILENLHVETERLRMIISEQDTTIRTLTTRANDPTPANPA